MTNEPQAVLLSDIAEFDLKCGRDFLIYRALRETQMMPLYGS